MTSAVAYFRVSTDRQAESGLGLDAQRSAIEKYAKDNDVHIAGWFADEGVSGAAQIEQRPQLAAALHSLPKGGLLVVAKLDRLARDVFMAAWVRMRVKARDGRVVSCAGEGTDDDSPAGTLLASIVDAFSQYERAVIAARTKGAKAIAKARGDFIGGSAPYGWKLSDGRLVKDAEEQAMIRKAKALRAKPLSWSKVCLALGEAGYHPRGGGAWHATQVQRICK